MEEKKTMLEWGDFSPLFGTWADRFKKFFDEGGFDSIYTKLKKDSLRGKQIAPLSENVFKAFEKTPFDAVKCVIVGLSPYHTFYKNLPIADGMALSCSITGKLQPSLQLFYEAMERELGVTDIVKEPDLSYLCEQGVLLINLGLTVEKMKPSSHSSLWEGFMKYLFEEVLLTTGMPVVFLGKEAAKLERYLAPFTWVIKVAHPASAAYVQGDWDSEGLFLQIDKIIQGNNGGSIKWYKD